jgi:hypothetical protein
MSRKDVSSYSMLILSIVLFTSDFMIRVSEVTGNDCLVEEFSDSALPSVPEWMQQLRPKV